MSEVVDVAEITIHRCKPHVRDLVEFLQFGHHVSAELAPGDLALRPVVQDLLCAIGNVIDISRLDRPLLARLQQAGHQLRSLEAFARAVLLHHHVGNLFDSLVAGKPLLARGVETLAAATDDVALAALARIHYLVADVTTKGTLHRTTPSSIGLTVDASALNC